MSFLPPRRDATAAIKLVRQILSEGPQTFQSIVTAGLKLHPLPAPEQPGPRYIQHPELPPALRKTRAPLHPVRIPRGHPFYSCHYLKKEVLDRLIGHRLIHKEFVASSHSKDTNSKAKTSSTSSESPFQYLMSSPLQARAGDPVKQWSLPEHWDRLCAGENHLKPLSELQTLIKAQAAVTKERQQDKGTLKRTEREIWEWEGREPEMTTPLQRLHMNKRRQKARSQKEAKRIAQRQQFDKMREVVRLREEKREQRTLAASDGSAGTLQVNGADKGVSTSA